MSERHVSGTHDLSEVQDAKSSVHSRRTSSLVLVVDDEEHIRNLHRRILDRSGVSVVVAQNGREALTLVQEGGVFDAVISDVTMPELDGLTLFRELRKIDRTVPVIFVTGNPMIQVASTDSQELHASGLWCLAKPVQAKDLTQAVMDAIAFRLDSTRKTQCA